MIALAGDDRICSRTGDSAEWKLGEMPICGESTPAGPGLLATCGDGSRNSSKFDGESGCQARSACLGHGVRCSALLDQWKMQPAQFMST